MRPSSMLTRRRRMKLLAALLGALAAGCSRETPPAPRASAAIGERCLDCHTSKVRSYRDTGMARAVEALRPGELDGLAPVADAAGWSYRFQGGAIRESTADGSPAIDAPIAFAIGAG